MSLGGAILTYRSGTQERKLCPWPPERVLFRPLFVPDPLTAVEEGKSPWYLATLELVAVDEGALVRVAHYVEVPR